MHTSHCSLLEKPTAACTACHPRKTTTYILHVVPLRIRTPDASQLEKRNNENTKNKGKEKKDKAAKKTKTERKEKTRQERQEETRQAAEAREGKKKSKKNVILVVFALTRIIKSVVTADPRN